ncbi:MAG: hypothetical protein K6L76_14460 [Agarilytica sp.]
MYKIYPFFVFLSALVFACAGQPQSLSEASGSYKQTKSYESLKVIEAHLRVGMTKKEVDEILGEYTYSPTDGQYYYVSSKTEYSSDQNREVSVGLVLDYNDSDGNSEQTLQSFWVGKIGE